MHINVVTSTAAFFTGRKSEKSQQGLEMGSSKSLIWQSKEKTDFMEIWQALDLFLWSCLKSYVIFIIMVHIYSSKLDFLY